MTTCLLIAIWLVSSAFAYWLIIRAFTLEFDVTLGEAMWFAFLCLVPFVGAVAASISALIIWREWKSEQPGFKPTVVFRERKSKR